MIDSDVEIADGEVVLIGDDLLISDDKNLMNEETKSLSAKKKRGKNQDAPSSVLPEKNGSLTITVNLVISNDEVILYDDDCERPLLTLEYS